MNGTNIVDVLQGILINKNLIKGPTKTPIGLLSGTLNINPCLGERLKYYPERHLLLIAFFLFKCITLRHVASSHDGQDRRNCHVSMVK